MQWLRDVIDVIGMFDHKWDISTTPHSSRLTHLCRRKTKFVRAMTGRWLQGRSIFQMQKSMCAYEFAFIMTACTIPSHSQAIDSQHPGGHEVLIPHEELFTSDCCWARESHFSSMNALMTSVIPPRLDPSLISQCKLYSTVYKKGAERGWGEWNLNMKYSKNE